MMDKTDINDSPDQDQKHSSGTALQWGLAIVVIALLAAAGFLLRDNIAMRDRIAQIQKERDLFMQGEQELQKKLSDQESVVAETKKELSRVREKLLRVQKQILVQQQPAAEEKDPPAVKIVPLSLLAHTRAFGKTQLLSLPAEVDYVAITLQLETTDFSEYQVALKDLDEGKTLWQSGKLTPSGKTIQFGMAAKLLEEENYIFELSGFSDPDTAPKIISGYPFRVVMQ